jgi:3-dehydroquinate synthase
MFATMVELIRSKNNNVQVGSILESQFNDLMNGQFGKAKKIVFVDENTHEYCWPYLLTNFEALKEAEVIVLPTGEENKTMEVCFQVWQALSEYKIKRTDVIINLGGGVVTDMGGFIASVYKRGIPFVNIPTTLLSMVDAAVGGKTGVNLLPWKNQLGTFTLPEFTFCDPIFLATLPEKEVESGKAEMIKHGLIADAAFYNELVQKNTFTTTKSIFSAIQIKANIVDLDPKESGERKKLNFGHTVGHAIEGLCHQEHIDVTHGECVAWGMIIEARLSEMKGLLSNKEVENIESSLLKRYGKSPLEENAIDALVELMYQDKKNNSEQLNCTLLTEIGNAKIDGQIEEDQMREVLTMIFNK